MMMPKRAVTSRHHEESRHREWAEQEARERARQQRFAALSRDRLDTLGLGDANAQIEVCSMQVAWQWCAMVRGSVR